VETNAANVVNIYATLDEDFHSVEILETGQTVWSAASQEEMSFL
jgi:hypothetical protein